MIKLIKLKTYKNMVDKITNNYKDMDNLRNKIQELEAKLNNENDWSMKLQSGFELAISEFIRLNVAKEKRFIGYWISKAIIKDKDDESKLLYVEPNFYSFLKLDRRSIQRVLKEVENVDLTISLKGSDEKIKEMIFDNMSTRLRDMIKEDMENMGPVRMRNIEEAKIRISKVIRRLFLSGEICFMEECV